MRMLISMVLGFPVHYLAVTTDNYWFLPITIGLQALAGIDNKLFNK